MLKTLAVQYFLVAGLLVFVARWRSFGVALVGAIALLVLVSVFREFWFLLLGAGLLTVQLGRDRRAIFASWMSPLVWTGLVLAAVIFAFVALAGTAYVGPNIDRQLMTGKVHMDTLYHASIAAMLREYGGLSTGLHGTPHVAYHAFSHFLLARLSALTELSVLRIYGNAQFIIFAPLLYLAVLACAEELAPSVHRREFLVRLAGGVVAFAGCFGFLEGSLGSRFGLWDSYALSESYNLSLVFFVALVGTIAIPSWKLRWPTVVVLVGASAAAKVSVGAIAGPLVVLYILLIEKNDRRLRLFIFGALVLGALFVLPFIFRWRQNYGLTIPWRDPFQFAKYYGEVAVDSSPRHPRFWGGMFRFTAIHFAYSLAFFGLAAASGWWRRDRWRHHADAMLLNGGAVLAGMAAIALLPCRTAGAIGSSVVYFSNVAMFVALPYLLGLVARPLGQSLRLSETGAWWCAAVCGVAGVAGTLFHAGPYLASGPRRLSRIDQPSTPEFARFIQHLISLRDDPTTYEYLIYIAKEEKGFWNAPSPYGFGQLPFYVPAVAERAALFGLPMPDRAEQQRRAAKHRHFARSETGLTPEGYGYDSYPLETYETGSADRLPDAVLLEETRRLGFRGYIDLTANGWTRHTAVAQ